MPVVVAVVAVGLAVGAGAASLMHRKGHDKFGWSILFIALGPLAFSLAISARRLLMATLIPVFVGPRTH